MATAEKVYSHDYKVVLTIDPSEAKIIVGLMNAFIYKGPKTMNIIRELVRAIGEYPPSGLHADRLSGLSYLAIPTEDREWIENGE